MEFDFSQNTSVADINKIPNDFRGLYKQVEDKFVLDNEHPGVKSAISAVTGLNTALKAARLEAKNRPTGVDLTLLKEYGETPEAIHTKISEVIDGLKTQIKGVNIDKIKQDLAKEFSDKLTGAETKATSLENQLFDTLVVGSASSAIAAAKGDVELLMPFIRTQVKTTVANGKYNVNVVDAAGDIRYSGVTGAPMSVAELVAEMKANERYGRLFQSEAPAGSGGPAGAAGRKQGVAAGTSRTNTEGMTAIEKISMGLKKGQAAKTRI